jgi:hypothetical protein
MNVRLPFRAILWLLIGVLAAPEATLALTGQLTHLSGAVVARRADGQSRILQVKSEVLEGDLLVTAANSYARVRFSDGSDVTLRPETQLKIEAFRYEERVPERDNVVLSLLKGGLRAATGLLARRNPASFKVATPTATVGIRGTRFGALLHEGALHVDVTDGRVVLITNAGTLEIGAGEFARARGLQFLPEPVPPERALRAEVPPQSQEERIGGGRVGIGQNLECAIP